MRAPEYRREFQRKPAHATRRTNQALHGGDDVALPSPCACRVVQKPGAQLDIRRVEPEPLGCHGGNRLRRHRSAGNAPRGCPHGSPTNRSRQPFLRFVRHGQGPQTPAAHSNLAQKIAVRALLKHGPAGSSPRRWFEVSDRNPTSGGLRWLPSGPWWSPRCATATRPRALETRVGHTLSAGKIQPHGWPDRQRIERHSRNHQDWHNWMEIVEIPPTGGLDEFDRKAVRNDYPFSPCGTWPCTR